MIGADALVPPNTIQPGEPNVSYTATPVFGSATAETSATLRRPHPLSACYAGLAMYAEQPDPAPDQELSEKPRALPSRLSEVPPTAVTYCEAAGNSTPKPLSPELTVMAIPGWL